MCKSLRKIFHYIRNKLCLLFFQIRLYKGLQQPFLRFHLFRKINFCFIAFGSENAGSMTCHIAVFHIKFPSPVWLNKRYGKGRRAAVFGVFNKLLIADNFCLAQIASPGSIILDVQNKIPHFLKFAGDQRFYI